MIEIMQDELLILLAISVRYSLGSRTYIVGDVCHIVKEHLANIDEQHKILIAKDIASALEGNNAGDECDIILWKNLLDEIKNSMDFKFMNNNELIYKKYIDKNIEKYFKEHEHIYNAINEKKFNPVGNISLNLICNKCNGGKIYFDVQIQGILTSDAMPLHRINCENCGWIDAKRFDDEEFKYFLKMLNHNLSTQKLVSIYFNDGEKI